MDCGRGVIKDSAGVEAGRGDEEAGMALAIKARSTWEDRFNRPTVDELVEAVPKMYLPAFESARAGLLELGLSESLGWHGVPWRWSLAYGAKERVLGYLVPSPVRPVLALPVPLAVANGLSPKKFSKAVRDSLAHAPVVGDVKWPSWELIGRGQAEELVALVAAVRGAA